MPGPAEYTGQVFLKPATLAPSSPHPGPLPRARGGRRSRSM